MSEQNQYILGTEQKELHRLGLQHQVWSSEANHAWKIADFSEGQTILDLGCGPGFCSLELAYIVGENGEIIGVDQSKGYLDFLESQAKVHGLENISTINAGFQDLNLDDESLDGVYHRWALAWIDDAEGIIAKLSKALKPGGVIASHEYYDWSLFQTEPRLPALNLAIKAALQSFKDSEGNINIGRQLPSLFHNAGLEVISTRTISKIGYNYDLEWQWPMTFLSIYIPKLVEKELLTHEEATNALQDLHKLEDIPGASICCPLMYEVIAVKT